MKTILNAVLSIVLMSISLSVIAAKPNPLNSADTDPQTVLETGVKLLQGLLSRGEQTDQKKLEAFVNNKLSPLFNFHEMSRFAGGPYYRNFSTEDQKQFRDQLETMFLTAMMQQLAIYNASSQPQVDVLPLRMRSATRAEAFARVIFPTGKIKKLRFLLYKGKAGWQIVDVSSNGKSAIIYYRNFFFREARKNGPQSILNLF